MNKLEIELRSTRLLGNDMYNALHCVLVAEFGSIKEALKANEAQKHMGYWNAAINAYCAWRVIMVNRVS